MSKIIGTFQSKKWGTVTVEKAEYHNGATAIQLAAADGMPLARLSVNTPLSDKLDPSYFFAKDWSENQEIAAEALESGLFEIVKDGPIAVCGYTHADCWKIIG